MADAGFSVRLDDAGTLARTQAALGDMPKKVDVARRRALRKLKTWVERQVLKAVSESIGTTQKTIKALSRFRSREATDGGLDIWIGTNPIDVHHLGTVRWTRRMVGARVGRRSYPGTFSWGEQGKTKFTQTRVFEREGSSRLPIRVVEEWVDDIVRRRIESLTADIAQRFETLMLQELRYALEVDGRQAA